MALPLAAAGSIWAAFNVARFGNPLQAGYDFGFTNPLGRGLVGLILSPGKGFFFDIGEYDLHTLTAEAFRHSTADAARGAGDDGDLTAEVVHRPGRQPVCGG